MRSLETKIPPVVLTALLALAAWLLSRWAPEAAAFSFGGQFALAAMCLVGGAALSLLGVKAFKEHQTTVNPTAPESTSQVVTTGVYRYTRNPMYLGFGLALLAAVIFVGNAFSVLVVPAYVAYMNRFQIAPEERALLAKFGEPFRDYMAAVRRWL